MIQTGAGVQPTTTSTRRTHNLDRTSSYEVGCDNSRDAVNIFCFVLIGIFFMYIFTQLNKSGTESLGIFRSSSGINIG